MLRVICKAVFSLVVSMAWAFIVTGATVAYGHYCVGPDPSSNEWFRSAVWMMVMPVLGVCVAAWMWFMHWVWHDEID